MRSSWWLKPPLQPPSHHERSSSGPCCLLSWVVWAGSVGWNHPELMRGWSLLPDELRDSRPSIMWSYGGMRVSKYILELTIVFETSFLNVSGSSMNTSHWAGHRSWIAFLSVEIRSRGITSFKVLKHILEKTTAFWSFYTSQKHCWNSN